MVTINRALYIGQDNRVFVRELSEEYKPSHGQALVRVDYSGVNPADIKHGWHFGLNDYVSGYECCGTVIQTGPSSLFAVGDVIFGSNATNKDKHLSHGAHQRFVIADSGHLWLRLPSDVPHSDAAVISIMVRTAADALFNLFQLPFPAADIERTASPGPILIWGGATSVGVAAIQLAKAAGLFPILTTASASNHKALLELGATKCFDYHDPEVVQDIQHELDKCGQPLKYVFDTVCSSGENSTTASCESITSAGQVKFASVLPVPGNSKWKMANASRAFDFPSPGGFSKAIPELDLPLQKASIWAVTNYGKGFIVPNVTVVKGADAAIEAMIASAEGKASFQKIAIQHPL